MASGMLYSIPIAVVLLGIVLLILGSFELGFRVGEHFRTQYDKEASLSLGPMVGGVLAMLAFVLAFTFAIAAGQHDLRKQNVLREANAVGTAYLRADLLDEPQRTEVKRLLREYVDIRVQAAKGENLDFALTRSVELHQLLWVQVLGAKTNPAPMISLVIQSINDVIDMHETRVTAVLHNRIPRSIWFALFVISALTMTTIGIQIGTIGKRRLIAIVPLILAFSVLATLVVDLDRPLQGRITTEQHAMINLQENMDRDTK
ncbi:MAG: hypothetical protein JSW48_08900 [Betaproteobacteria bacterium]|jgi:hypothetical protein|nr:MAG: hypothetical protein JSW48_08900 [Betaproteobacteria bacterium]